MKKFFALFMVLVLCMSTAVPAFAAEVSEDSSTSESSVVYDTRADRGSYESTWFDGSGSLQGREFTIYTGISGRFGLTFGIEDSTRTADVKIMLRNPSGNYIFLGSSGSPLCLLGTTSSGWKTEQAYVITGQPSGTYTVNANPVFAPNGVRVMCWIYDV